MTNIALIGGGGFLGSHLAAALLAQTEDRLTVIDPSLEKLSDIAEQPRLRRLQTTIKQPELVEEIVDEHEVVVSLSALCNPALYNTRPLDVIEASFNDLLPLVHRCTERGRWLVHLSTCEVYGAATGEPLREDSTALTVGPISKERWTYSCAKQLLERVIWALGRHHGLPFTIVRPFNVIGAKMDFLPGVDGEGTPRVLACFMDALLRRRPLPLVGGGRQRRSFIYVDDFVEAMVRLLARPEACRGEIINIGNPGNELSIAALARLLLDSCRKRGWEVAGTESVEAARFYGEGYDDVEQRIPDIAKARRLLAWEPRTALDEMLPPILDDYARRYSGRLRGASSSEA